MCTYSNPLRFAGLKKEDERKRKVQEMNQKQQNQKKKVVTFGGTERPAEPSVAFAHSDDHHGTSPTTSARASEVHAAELRSDNDSHAHVEDDIEITDVLVQE
eukprot:1090156-Prorocentrum_minimum.AAC.1